MKRTSLLLTLVGLCTALLFSACGGNANVTPDYNFTPEAGSGAAEEYGQDGVVALVNGQPVLAETYQRELARFEAGRLALGLQPADDAYYRQQVLDLLVEQELIRQQAASQGITVADAQVDEAINAIVAEQGEDYFNSWLQGSYYSLEEFRELMRLDLLTDQLLIPVIAAVPDVAEHAHARHILVNSETEASEALSRLDAGEDFTVLAAEYSIDQTTYNRGGDLGWFPRGVLLVREVEEIAFSLAPGTTSGIVQSPWGYHIIQTLEVDPARPVSEEARQELIARTIEQWRLSLRNGADIQQLVVLES